MDNKEIFLIPYAHLDTQWRWEYPTTIEDYLKDTIEKNLALFAKYPEHRFNFTGALRYEMMKEYYPEDFGKVVELVRAGLWNAAGTCLDETDALAPTPESLVRNILYGHRWALAEFGRSSRDYMLPDCFGFPANFPTVLAHCGITGFSSQKLTWGSAVGVPFHIGIWEGPDGSELLSALDPYNYVSYLRKPVRGDRQRRRRLDAQGKSTGVWKSFQYYGVGDMGGAPTERCVRRVSACIAKNGSDKSEGIAVRQGSPDEFFAGLGAEERARLARHKGDLLLVNHSAGSLTSAAAMKRWNRLNEQLAFAAEAAAAAALQAAGAPYPAARIEGAWKRVIGNQMHDILPGTCTPTAYEFSHNDEVLALGAWTAILEDAASAIAPRLAGDGGILLFNPAPDARADLVDLVLPAGGEAGGLGRGALAARSAIGPDGTAVPVRTRPDGSGGTVLTLAPPLEALSWSRWSLSDREVPLADPVSLSRDEKGWLLENGALRVRVGPAGSVDSVFAKSLAREVLARPVAYELQRERPRQYPAWNMDWRDRRRPAFLRVEGGTVTVLEEGGLRARLRVESRIGASTLVRELALSAGSDLVEFVERVEWRGQGRSLKLAVSAAMADPRATFNWETSREERGLNREKLFEMPSRLWADLSEGKTWGLTVIEDSKYGWDRPKADTLRLSLLYTPATRLTAGFFDQRWQDWGSHVIRWSLRPHAGDWRGADIAAQRLNKRVRPFLLKGGSSAAPAVAFRAGDQGSAFKDPGAGAPAAAPASLSLLKTLSPGLGVLAVKAAEEGGGFVVRLYERHGSALESGLEFPADIAEARTVNGLEEDLGPAAFEGRRLRVSLPANGLKAYRVRLADAAPPAGCGQRALGLPLDERLSSANRETAGGPFPAELFPSTIRSGRVVFSLGGAGGPDALACAGQVLALGEGEGELSLLAAASADRKAVFTWLDADGAECGREELEVPAMTGFVGQWDRRIWARRPGHFESRRDRRDYNWLNRCTGVEPGFVKRARIEWYATHSHEDGADRPYRYAYLFGFRLERPAGAAALRLPADPAVKLFAATAAEAGPAARAANLLLDRFDF